MVSELICSGLREEYFPLAALAAYGLLQTCTEDLELPGCRLSWRRLPQWTAVIDLPEGIDTDQLLPLLAQSAPQLRLSSPWRQLPVTFPQMLLEPFAAAFSDAAVNATADDRRRADALVAAGTDLVANSKKRVQASPLCMPQSGNSPWAKRVWELEDLLAHDAATAADLFREAILGPWLYREEQSSLGLDPSTVRLHAYRARNPVPEGTAHGVPGAIWLALQAFVLFPCACDRRHVETAAIAADVTHGTDALLLPIWTDPIGLDTLRSLLSMVGGVDGRRRHDLTRRGVEAVFSSTRRPRERGTYALAPSVMDSDE